MESFSYELYTPNQRAAACASVVVVVLGNGTYALAEFLGWWQAPRALLILAGIVDLLAVLSAYFVVLTATAISFDGKTLTVQLPFWTLRLSTRDIIRVSGDLGRSQKGPRTYRLTVRTAKRGLIPPYFIVEQNPGWGSTRLRPDELALLATALKQMAEANQNAP